MDWKLLLSTFVTVFVAELGDKTQLATFTLAASSSSKVSVLIGASLALIATTIVAVVAGSALGHVISPVWIKRMAGVMFIVLGVLYLAKP